MLVKFKKVDFSCSRGHAVVVAFNVFFNKVSVLYSVIKHKEGRLVSVLCLKQYKSDVRSNYTC